MSAPVKIAVAGATGRVGRHIAAICAERGCDVALRAAQFHEFVGQLLDWGTRDDAATVPRMQTRLVAARAVAQVAADLALAPALAAGGYTEVAGPRVESLPEIAALLAARRGYPATVTGGSDPGDPDRDLYENGGLLPGPGAILAGPTYEEWLVADWRP
jgi:uncharacterized protein YbjT (DUF2867 family)